MLQLGGLTGLGRGSAVYQLEQWLWWISVAAHAVLFFRLRLTGLHRTYRWFTAYVGFSVARGIVIAVVPYLGLKRSPKLLFGFVPTFSVDVGHYSQTVYGWLWVTTNPLTDLLYVLVVLELVTLILVKFRGIASLGRWVVLAGLIGGVLVAALTLSRDLSNPAERFPILRSVFVLDRGTTSSLVLFLLFIAIFLVWYPVPLSRNLLTHFAIYSIYFVVTTLAILLRNIGGDALTDATSMAGTVATLGRGIAWLVLLDRAGEERASMVRAHWNPEQQQRVMEQLAAINASLLRTARK